MYFRYAFLEFANEKFAEKNFKILKGKTIDGKEILVDYVGSKSEHKKPKRKIKETGKYHSLLINYLSIVDFIYMKIMTT